VIVNESIIGLVGCLDNMHNASCIKGSSAAEEGTDNVTFHYIAHMTDDTDAKKMITFDLSADRKLNSINIIEYSSLETSSIY